MSVRKPSARRGVSTPVLASMKHALIIAVCSAALSLASASETTCEQAAPKTVEVFKELAAREAALHMKVQSQDILVSNVLACGDNVEVLAFPRNRIINLHLLFDGQTRKLLEFTAEDG